MKLKFGWGAGIIATLLLALAISFVRRAIAERERERAAIARCETHCRIAGLCIWEAKTKGCRSRNSADCRQADVCKTNGRCSYNDGQCEVTSDDECQSSEQCREAGRCHFTADTLVPCAPAGDEDCAKSTICRRLGRCSAQAGACRVTKDVDCAGSEVCVKHGSCSAKPSETPEGTVQACAAVSNDDCKKGEDCRERGMCTRVGDDCR